MLSYIVDAVLLVALVLTAVRVGSMRRELKAIRTLHLEYREEFDRTTDALVVLRDALRALNIDGTGALQELGARIEEARELAVRIEAAREASVEPNTIGAALLGRRASKQNFSVAVLR